MKKHLTFLLIFIASAAISGCGSLPTYVAYEGDRLPSSSEAHILGNKDTSHEVLNGLNDNVLIACVNGKSAQGPVLTTSKYKYPFDAALTPGRNYIGTF